MVRSVHVWHREWRQYGCALVYLKAFTTAQVALALPCVAAQILLYFLCQRQWECIVFPSSVSSILYLIGGCVGIASLAKRQKALLAAYLLIGSAAILAQVTLVTLSIEKLQTRLWDHLTAGLNLTAIHAWLLLIFSVAELLLFVFSSLSAAMALSHHNPAFKDKTLGFKTSTVRREVLVSEEEMADE